MSETSDIHTIKARLRSKLEEAGTTMRAASLAAGKGPGYVQNLLSSETDPTVSALMKICNANNISFSYVAFGLEMTPETRRLLDIVEKDPEKLPALLALLSK